MVIHAMTGVMQWYRIVHAYLRSIATVFTPFSMLPLD